MEGVTLNAKDKQLYIAMSYVEKAMEKDTKGTDPVDDIQVNKLSAGVTYELALNQAQKDRNGQPINSQYVPTVMKGLVWGEDLAAADTKGNLAAEDKVANPDNLSYSESLRTLFIGEDSGKHVNNFVWAYNVDTKKLSRILTTPAGAEATGLQAVDNLNGFSYIMSNLQHPGDEMIVAANLKPEVESYINQNFDSKKSGAVGYISGLPSVQQLEEAAPSVTPDTTLAPLRETAKAAGANVIWHGSKKEVVITYHSHTLIVKVGTMTADIDGKMIDLPVADFNKRRQGLILRQCAACIPYELIQVIQGEPPASMGGSSVYYERGIPALKSSKNWNNHLGLIIKSFAAVILLLSTSPHVYAHGDESSMQEMGEGPGILVTVDGRILPTPGVMSSDLSELRISVREAAEALQLSVKWDSKHHAVLIGSDKLPLDMQMKEMNMDMGKNAAMNHDTHAGHDSMSITLVLNGKALPPETDPMSMLGTITAVAGPYAEALGLHYRFDASRTGSYSNPSGRSNNLKRNSSRLRMS